MSFPSSFPPLFSLHPGREEEEEEHHCGVEVQQVKQQQRKEERKQKEIKRENPIEIRRVVKVRILKANIATMNQGF